MEGHRWIDVRRYNLLSTLPIDRPGDDVWAGNFVACFGTVNYNY